MLQPILETQNLVPGPWSQTTCTWPLVLKEGDQKIISQGVGHDIGSPIIQASREETTDRLIERILTEHAGAWERLAAL